MDELFAVSVFDMYIFDENGKLVVKTSSLIGGNLVDGKITAEDAAYNLDLIRFLNERKSGSKSDYERFLELGGDYKSFAENNNNLYVKINPKKSGKRCKVVLVGDLCNVDTGKSKRYVYDIPNAVIDNKYDLETMSDGVSCTSFEIKVEPYNDDGDLFDLMVLDNNSKFFKLANCDVRCGKGNTLLYSDKEVE
jgi:hypothetical protein